MLYYIFILQIQERCFYTYSFLQKVIMYFAVLCGKGTSYDVSTKTCKRCPVGSYRNVLTNVVSACTKCPSGRTTPTDGATDASYCIGKKKHTCIC